MNLQKTLAEEAYKKVFNQYPTPDSGPWKLFKVGFEYGKNSNSIPEKSFKDKLKEKYPSLDVEEMLNIFVTEFIK